MEEINIEELGWGESANEYGGTIHYEPKDAIEVIALKVNEIVRVINNKKNQLLL